PFGETLTKGAEGRLVEAVFGEVDRGELVELPDGGGEVDDSQSGVPSKGQAHQFGPGVAVEDRSDVDEVARLPPGDERGRLGTHGIVELQDGADIELDGGPLAPVPGQVHVHHLGSLGDL